MSFTEMILATGIFLKRHRLLLLVLALATAAPSAIIAVPESLAHFAELSPRIRLTLMAIAAVLAVAVVIALSRGLCRALVRAWHKRLEDSAKRHEKALWNSAFKNGNLIGAESVPILWRAAGSVTNVMKTPSQLSATLMLELALARRGVLILPYNSPGVGLDTPPQLAFSEAGEPVAEFFRPPVRDDSGAAGRQAAMWVTRQLPFLNSFMSSVETRVAINVVGRGCSSLTDALVGFGPEIRGTEGNLVFYIHDAQDEHDPEEDAEAEPEDSDEIDEMIYDMWMRSPAR